MSETKLKVSKTYSCNHSMCHEQTNEEHPEIQSTHSLEAAFRLAITISQTSARIYYYHHGKSFFIHKTCYYRACIRLKVTRKK